MNLPHIHLLLNHVPTVGTVIAVGLLLMSFVRRNDALQRISLEALCIIALMTIPAYISGIGTEQMLQVQDPVRDLGLPDHTPERMARHHDAAVSAFAMMVLAGGFAWLGLWQSRRIGRPGRVTLGAVALLSVVTLTAMGRTATLGGEIRHPEIGDTAQAAGGAITALKVSDFINMHTWAWPSMEVLHFVGLWLLFGVVLVVNLRLLGLMKDTPYAGVHRLLPWAVLGLGINIFTGMLFVIAAPAYYASNPAFHAKIALLLIAGADLLYLTTFDGPWQVAAGGTAPRRVQAMALLAIVSWIGVMYFGRMLPFLGEGA